jgi:hypothetical protein
MKLKSSFILKSQCANVFPFWRSIKSH